MKREFLDYLEDINDAMAKAMEFVKDMEYDDFLKDDKTISAVIRKLEIIGEAVKKIPKKIKDDYSQIPWREMAKMRDKLIHEYFGIDSKRVWKTVKKDIPTLKLLFEKILKDLKGLTPGRFYFQISAINKVITVLIKRKYNLLTKELNQKFSLIYVLLFLYYLLTVGVIEEKQLMKGN